MNIKETSTELKKCPHCGGPALLRQGYAFDYDPMSPNDGNWTVYVECSVCGSRGKAYECDEEPYENDWNLYECHAAEDAWNLRVNSEE